MFFFWLQLQSAVMETWQPDGQANFFSIFIGEERDVRAWILSPLVFIQAAQSALGFEKETEIKDRKKLTTVPRSNRKTTSFLAMGEESISYSQQVSSCLKII